MADVNLRPDDVVSGVYFEPVKESRLKRFLRRLFRRKVQAGYSDPEERRLVPCASTVPR